MFVCHGNICRSPMAEFIMKKLVTDAGLQKDFYISSSATSCEEIWNDIGNPVYPPARSELKKHGISCEGKRAVQLKASDYDYSDYLIGMDNRNIRNMERMTNHKKGEKIALMLEYAGMIGSECQDPWYNSRFDQTYRDVVTGCTAFLEYLEKEGKI